MDRDGRECIRRIWNCGNGVKSGKDRKVNGRMRFVSESLPSVTRPLTSPMSGWRRDKTYAIPKECQTQTIHRVNNSQLFRVGTQSAILRVPTAIRLETLIIAHALTLTEHLSRSSRASGEDRKVNGRMRFVSESLPRLIISVADGSDSYPRRLLSQLNLLGWFATPILAGFRTLLCLTSEIGRTLTLGVQPLTACAS
ncbi:hypothetical protein WN51_07415 [Melipona quadrifasciata]|uniref:Uncharacterized protein n=1 Tax=Melipona quadrifasciata TaxID=166423 RepID=A0A0M8ZSH3_9HYME|nr:hypothetical protein WN51_07415 [Melipona quadrifasciata]